VVVAIDFGTTYSGYAYSFTSAPEEVHIMRKWEGEHHILRLMKNTLQKTNSKIRRGGMSS
jgi:hypothetical protein